MEYENRNYVELDEMVEQSNILDRKAERIQVLSRELRNREELLQDLDDTIRELELTIRFLKFRNRELCRRLREAEQKNYQLSNMVASRCGDKSLRKLFRMNFSVGQPYSGLDELSLEDFEVDHRRGNYTPRRRYSRDRSFSSFANFY